MTGSSTSTRPKAVIFDIGGVVVRSPFIAIAEYEREHDIPENYLNVSITGRGDHGAWQKFERGELPLFDFYKQFSRDLSDTVNGNVWYTAYCEKRGIACPRLPEKLDINGRELFGRMMQVSQEYDPHIKLAIQHLRASNAFKIIALTNNFSREHSDDTNQIPRSELQFLGWEHGAVPPGLKALFDDFVDSSVVGMRKPEPGFYLLACERNGIRPEEALFLDDIRMNLKAAKALGMKTIHVPLGRSLDAVKELEQVVGMDLTPALKQNELVHDSKTYP